MLKKSLAIGIVFLFVFSTTASMVFGYNKDSSTSVKEESLCFTVTFPDINSVNIFKKKGSHRLELECFGYLMIHLFLYFYLGFQQ